MGSEREAARERLLQREAAYVESLLARHEANYRAYLDRLTETYRQNHPATRAALANGDGG